MGVADLYDYAQDRARDSLRAFAWYTGDEHGLLYVDEDIDEDVAEQRLTAIHGRLGCGRVPEDESMGQLGDVITTVQVREEAAIMNFRMSAGQGVLVSLEPDVAKNLHEFAMECREYLGDSVFTVRNPAG